MGMINMDVGNADIAGANIGPAPRDMNTSLYQTIHDS